MLRLVYRDENALRVFRRCEAVANAVCLWVVLREIVQVLFEPIGRTLRA